MFACRQKYWAMINGPLPVVGTTLLGICDEILEPTPAYKARISARRSASFLGFTYWVFQEWVETECVHGLWTRIGKSVLKKADVDTLLSRECARWELSIVPSILRDLET